MKQLRKRFYLLLGLAFLLISVGRNVQATSTMGTKSENTPGTLTATGVAAFVDSYVAQKMAAAHAPGLVVSVVHRGQVLLARGYGLADLESGRPMTAQTPLRAGSVSKPVTAAAVLQLVAQGTIALDEPVSAYLPDLLPVDNFGPAGTVAQFLTLKGGYADTVVQTHTPNLENWQPLDIFLRENLPPRVLPPGKVHSYNSWEHGLLGQAMAEVMGQPFAETMAGILFRPLGLAQTTFVQPLPPALAANLATGYAFNGETYEEVPLDYVQLSPGIGLVTTGDDMARFMLALLGGGRLERKQVLAPATVEGLLQRQQPVHPRSRGRTYGFSEITLGERQVLYQDGNGIGQGNRMILVPEQELGIFLSTNHRPLAGDISTTPAFDFVKELGTVLLKQYVPATRPEASPLPPLPAAVERAGRYTGHYRLAGTPQDDFFKLGALLDNVNVTDNGDGTISIGTARYAEVEALLFQSKSDPSFFVVFVEDDQGRVRWLTFGGTNSYEKVRWYETPTFQLGLVGAMLLVFLVFAVAMPFGSRRIWPVWLLSVLNIAFLAGLALMMARADLVLFFKTVPPATKLLFLLPWLSGALALTLPPALVALWRNQATSWIRLLYTLDTVATIGFLWFVYYWNLYWR